MSEDMKYCMKMAFPRIDNGGCNFFATKRINKTARTTNYRLTTIKVWSTLLALFTLIEIMPIIMCAPLTNSQTLLTHQQSLVDTGINRMKPVRTVGKRSSHRRHMRHNVPWGNACGGQHVPASSITNNTYGDSNEFGSRSISDVETRKAVYKVLRRSIVSKILSIEGSRDSAPIKTDDISEWFKHNETYTFLSQVRPNANVTLATWHRDVQIYVGAFEYLHRKQREIDAKYPKNVPLSHELNSLLNSAKQLLCEIETAFNQTHIRDLKIISDYDMRRRLTFRTNKLLHEGQEIYEVDPIDLKFTKVRYYEYLVGLKGAIRRWSQRHNSHRNRQKRRRRNQRRRSAMSSAERKGDRELNSSEISANLNQINSSKEVRNNRRRINRKINKNKNLFNIRQ